MDNQQVTNLIHTVVDLMQSLNVHSFTLPPKMLIGRGSITKAGEALTEAGAKSVSIVIDSQLYEMGLADGLYRALKRSNIQYLTIPQEKGEPNIELINGTAKQLEEREFDAVIAIGSGAIIDSVKALLHQLNNRNLFIDYGEKGASETGESELNDHRRSNHYFIAIPTTAGAGSEATNYMMIRENDHVVKHTVGDVDLIPDLVILDVALTLSVPPSVTAATGIDALTHAIEAYVGRQSTFLSEAFASQALKLIWRALPVAVGQGDNLNAREEMMLASFMAGVACSNAGLGLSHALAHQIAPHYKISHGMANAILLPSVMHFNALVCEEKYREMGVLLTGRATESQAMIGLIQNLIEDIGLPKNLNEINADPEDFEGFVADVLHDNCLVTNPRKVEQLHILQVLHHAFNR